MQTTPVLGPTHTTPTYTYSYSSPSLTSSTTPSATSSNASSIGGLSVGAVVGIVGGGLFGILAVLALGTYLLVGVSCQFFFFLSDPSHLALVEEALC